MAGPWVLVIEDEEQVRDVWVETLSLAGYTPLGVATAAEVFEWLPDWTPQLILLDMMMPDVDGFEFLARLRRNPGWDHVPVLIVSALGHELSATIDSKGVLALGVAGILAKPVHLDVLTEHVRRIIGPGEPAGGATDDRSDARGGLGIGP